MPSSNDILYSKGKNDENYTLPYAVEPILKYIPKDKIVWCPFDTSDSEFVKQISKQNQVIHSHISDGKDFFTYEPEQWDIIISNPPFGGKRQIFERALSFGKPFALIMANTWLNDKYSKWVYYEANRQMQLLMFDKRMRFCNEQGEVLNKITFSSSYFCCDLLPKDIVIEKLNN
jgi:hypothetical protein